LRTKCLAAVLLFLTLAVAVRTASSQARGYYPKGGPDDAPQVSLIQLIANPQAYDKKVVRIIGYLHLEFEGDAVYFHQDDFEHGMYENSIWIKLPNDISPTQIKAVNDKYVICTARFAASNHGHMGMFAGELGDVTRLEVWPAYRGIPPPPPPKPLK
jgi:hypothetical protein